ncbi:type II toxin-antitoxin system VapC family toxin [Elizabethkingia anophelis]|uniref:type II toxin-antitoxin system VapC family toxin n=1 Tax=Elizabethkingia anophelis TaxID=1117645 RepID=UPI0038914FD5
MPKVYSVKEFNVKTNKTYFFDNNVWISLFAPLINSQKKKQENASNFLASILAKNSQIVLSSLIISEFANVYLRFDYEQWKKKNQNPTAHFKLEYKLSADYKIALEDVKALIRKIENLDITEKHPDNFNSINLENILSNFDIDFNDSYYAHICENNNWILVTSDNDFDKLDISIEIVKI